MALEKLDSFEFTWEAELVRGLLESEGIQAFVFDTEHIRINWMLSNALGGVRVMVNRSDLDSANLVLANWRSGQYEQQLNPDPSNIIEASSRPSINSDSNHCQACGSDSNKPVYKTINKILFFIGMATTKGNITGSRCQQCNHKESLSE